jgi:hypothetical protein
MSVARITKRSVEGISIPAKGKRDHLWDDTLKGFGVMVTNAGSRSYIVQYRMGGRGFPSKTLTIGRHGSPWTADAARQRAAGLLELISKGIDPKQVEADEREKAVAREREQVSLEFGNYVDLFLHRHGL